MKLPAILTRKGLRDQFLLRTFKFLRWYFIGKKVTEVSILDGRKLIRDSGCVVGGVIRRDHSGMPVDMEIFLTRPGHSPTDMRRFSVLSVRREQQIGWVFYD